MRRAHLAISLGLLSTLTACQPSAGPPAANDPLSPSTPEITPSFSAAVDRFPINFFFLQDFDRDISATIGLVSAVSDLGTEPDCGGSGPEVYDGGGTQTEISTPAGSMHLRDRMQKATLVLYEGATNDVCELTTHPVIARGPVDFHFSIRQSAAGTVSFQVQMTGMVELTTGGQAHLLSSANFVFDSEGNLTVHVDRFELKPIGG